MTKQSRLLLFGVALFVAGAPAWSHAMGADPLAAELAGTWRGSGIYQGNEPQLTRTWTLELGGQFLRADMEVTMANGASFGALTYWKSSADGEYQVLWLDATGRMQALVAERDEITGAVSSEFIDEFTEAGPQRRRWQFQSTGETTYVERLFEQKNGQWQLLTEWQFVSQH